jgi:hypothetical protein
LGFACCDLSRAGPKPDIYDVTLWQSGVIHPQGLELHHKWANAYEQLAAQLHAARTWPTHLCVEWPMFFGSARGHVAAALDHTIGLAAMAAGIIGWFQLPPSQVSCLTPNQWKGSVPKDVTRSKLEKAFNGDSSELSDDEVDAIGIAVFWLSDYFRKSNEPPLDERHADKRAHLIRLVAEARDKCNGNDSAWWSRISTILRRRRDIGVVVYTVLTVRETPLHEPAQFELASVIKTFFFKPSRYPDLSWVLLARLLVMMGIWGVFYFLQYYFDDVLGGPGVETIIFGSNFSGEGFSGTLFLPTLLMFALPTSLIAGWLSDRHGRKVMVYTSGAVMTVVCVVFIIFQNQYGALIAGAFFGIGYGAYTSVDWALTTDALPPTDEAGKFMGIWSAMGILPQVIGIAIGAVILQLLRDIPNHFGYTLLFLVTIVYFGLGTLVIRQVRGVR